MGRDLYNNSSSARKLMEQVTSLEGLDHLPSVIFEGPDELLTRTDNVQPAITTVSLMVWAAMVEMAEKYGQILTPLASAGHSLGEYAAHAAAGNLSSLQAVSLTASRGKWMNEASQPPNPKGGMVAVMGISLDRLEEVFAQIGDELVSIANVNSPGQIILSGEHSAIVKASEAAMAAGAKRVILLNVSGGWHSPLMKSAQIKMEGLLSHEIVDQNVSINRSIPVIANATSDVVSSVNVMRDTLGRQITSPVIWTDCVRRLLTFTGYPGLPSEYPDSEKTWPLFVEVGPGKVLRGLLRSIDKGLETVGVEDTASLEAFIGML